MLHRESRSICIVLLSCLALASCKVGQDYVRPHLNLPASYRDADSSAFPAGADSTLISDLSWNEFFSDTVLVRLIDSAVVNNHDMRAALKNIEIADQWLKQSRMEFLPEINAEWANITREFRSKNFYSSPTSAYYEETGKTPPENMYQYTPENRSQLSLSWELDVWGKMRRQTESALADYLQTHEARKAIQTSLVASIAEGYYNLLMLDEQLEVARRNLQLTDSTLRIVQLLHEAGEETELAIRQTESQRFVAAALIPELEQEITIQENALKALVGEMPGNIRRQVTLSELDTTDTNELLATGVPLQMVANRPDVREAELILRSTNAQIGVAQAYRYPSLIIDAEVGLNAMMPENWFNIPGSLFGGIFGSITQPLFNRRKLKTAYEVAKLERDKAEIDFQQTVLEAVNEVSNSLVMVKKLKERHAIAEQRVKNNRRGVEAANLLFSAGEATYLEVITAQSNALDSELHLASIKQQQLNARVALYKALGGGWKSTDSD